MIGESEGGDGERNAVSYALNTPATFNIVLGNNLYFNFKNNKAEKTFIKSIETLKETNVSILPQFKYTANYNTLSIRNHFSVETLPKFFDFIKNLKELNSYKRGGSGITSAYFAYGTLETPSDQVPINFYVDSNGIYDSIDPNMLTIGMLIKLISLCIINPKLSRLLIDNSSTKYDLTYLPPDHNIILNKIFQDPNLANLKAIKTLNDIDSSYVIKKFLSQIEDFFKKSDLNSSENVITLKTPEILNSLSIKEVVYLLPTNILYNSKNLLDNLEEFEYCIEHLSTLLSTLNNAFNNNSKDASWNKCVHEINNLVHGKEDDSLSKVKDAINKRMLPFLKDENFFYYESAFATPRNPLNRFILDKILKCIEVNSQDINDLIKNKDKVNKFLKSESSSELLQNNPELFNALIKAFYEYLYKDKQFKKEFEVYFDHEVINVLINSDEIKDSFTRTFISYIVPVIYYGVLIEIFSKFFYTLITDIIEKISTNS
jgi:hypothetical protein